MNKRKNLINGLSERMINLSSEILCCRFGRSDRFLVVMVGIICAALQRYAAGTTSYGIVLAAAFGMGMYFLFRVYLPFHTYMRSEHIIRYRYAFGSMAAAGVLSVMASKSSLSMFSSVNADGLIAVAAIMILSLLVRFILRGERLVLALIYLSCGALCAWSFYGVMVLLIIHLVFFVIRVKFNAISKEIGFDESYDNEFVRQMDTVSDNLSMVSSFRMMVVVCVLVGFVGALALRTNLEHQPLSLDGVANLVNAVHIDGVKTFFSEDGVMFFASLVMAFFAIYFLERATDVQERLPNHLMLLYGILLMTSLATCYNASDTLLIKLNLQMSLICRVILGAVLMLSGSVFVTELCCREADVGYLRHKLSQLSVVNSHIARHLRALVFALSVLAGVLAPVVLRILNSAGEYGIIRTSITL